MPVPIYDPKMDYRNRLPAPVDPYAELSTALSGGIGQVATQQEADRKAKEDTLFKVLSTGNIPAQPTQQNVQPPMPSLETPNLTPQMNPEKGFNVAPQGLQLPLAPTQQITEDPTKGYIATPQLQSQGITGIAPKQQGPDKAIALEAFKQQGRRDLLQLKQDVTKDKFSFTPEELETYADGVRSGNIKIQDIFANARGADTFIAKKQLYDKIFEKDPNFSSTDIGIRLAQDTNIGNARLKVSADNALKVIDDVLKLNDEAKRLGYPAVDTLLNKARIKFGDVPISNFYTLNKILADDLSVVLRNGASTDLTLELGLGIADPNQSTQQVLEGLQLLKTQIQRKEGLMKNIGLEGLPSRKAKDPQQSGGLDSSAILAELRKAKSGGK